MKYLLTLFFICYTSIAFSQDSSTVENKKPDTFDLEAKPSTNSELSLYFEKNLSKNLISEAELTKKRKRLMLTFSFDENDRLVAETNAKSKQLNDAIIKAFKKYPKEKLNLEYDSPFNFYYLQILEFENGENIIKCNTVLIPNSHPILMKCRKSKNSEEVKNCNQSLLANYIITNFNTSIAKKTGIVEAKIYVMFKITPSGKIEDIKVKAPNISLEIETIRIINMFPFELYKPSYHNGKTSSIKYSLPLRIQID